MSQSNDHRLLDDTSRIDYHVLLDDETIAYVPESDIERKDYSLF